MARAFAASLMKDRSRRPQQTFAETATFRQSVPLAVSRGFTLVRRTRALSN
jgi:hypothetical protein